MKAALCLALALALALGASATAADRGQHCRYYETLCRTHRGDRCVDTHHDAHNCGACGVRCASDKCRHGACTPCHAPAIECDGKCRPSHYFTTRADCGACGVKCAAGEVCQYDATARKHRCMDACPTPGHTLCNGKCRPASFFQSNNGSCGRCNHKCQHFGTACVAGQCCVSLRRRCSTAPGASPCCPRTGIAATCVHASAQAGAPTVCAVPPHPPVGPNRILVTTPPNGQYSGNTIGVTLAVANVTGGSTDDLKHRVTITEVVANKRRLQAAGPASYTITQTSRVFTFAEGGTDDNNVKIPALCAKSWSVKAAWLNAAGSSTSISIPAVEMGGCPPSCCCAGECTPECPEDDPCWDPPDDYNDDYNDGICWNSEEGMWDCCNCF